MRHVLQEPRSVQRWTEQPVALANPHGPLGHDRERAPYLGSALALTVAEDEVFVIGGGKIYTEALPMAHRMYLTHVHAEVEGDTRFPEWDPAEWEMVSEERHEADDRHAHAFTIRRYDRRSA
jgi:hypothetical protein